MNNIKTTKTIRFKLESNSNNNLIQGTIDNLGKNNDFDLSNFVQNLDNFIYVLFFFVCCFLSNWKLTDDFVYCAHYSFHPFHRGHKNWCSYSWIVLFWKVEYKRKLLEEKEDFSTILLGDGVRMSSANQASPHHGKEW